MSSSFFFSVSILSQSFLISGKADRKREVGTSNALTEVMNHLFFLFSPSLSLFFHFFTVSFTILEHHQSSIYLQHHYTTISGLVCVCVCTYVCLTWPFDFRVSAASLKTNLLLISFFSLFCRPVIATMPS